MKAKLKVTFSSPLVRITQLVRGFSATWKQSVEAMSRDVMRSFTNFKNGTSIIQVRRACPSTDGDQCRWDAHLIPEAFFMLVF